MWEGRFVPLVFAWFFHITHLPPQNNNNNKKCKHLVIEKIDNFSQQIDNKNVFVKAGEFLVPLHAYLPAATDLHGCHCDTEANKYFFLV